ncbi:ABC transporter substrate-binding protein [Mesorhizobium sp. M0510]|uniref:ABC transporter substrate-binding protein n=1 Tax=Mesorhizobium sp. M0510 TaxID=2956954 RepID=UPI003336BB7C
MTISRRNLIKAGLAVGMASSNTFCLRAQAAPTADRRSATVRMVIDNLSNFDPCVSSADATLGHALAIYDTLFSVDSKLVPQPQMVGRWSVSDDKRIYTFVLRDDLSWHDGTPVTAADCVASIRRWGQVTAGGQLLMARATQISKEDDRTFKIALKQPLGILLNILTGPFVMREKDANQPATEQVTANIGSGPFRFNHALAKPGASFTYDRNEKYVPRSEPSDGLAGGKIVRLDRVIWDIGLLASQQTAVAALQAGEIDFILAPPVDLLPVIDSDPNLELRVLNRLGNDYVLRMNCLQKPFDNVKARQAILHLVDQEAMMRAAVGNPDYFSPVTSMFGNKTPMTNDENTGWYKKGGDPEKAKQLFKEAGYAGEKVVILQPTDWAESSNTAQLLAKQLRDIGVNAELAPSDWAGLVAHRAKKGPVEDGGWSIFITTNSEASLGDVASNSSFAMNGEKGWYGWPQDDQYETLRAAWSDVETLEERKIIARKMQKIWWDYVPSVLLGQSVTPSATRKTLTGFPEVPGWYVALWNIESA